VSSIEPMRFCVIQDHLGASWYQQLARSKQLVSSTQQRGRMAFHPNWRRDCSHAGGARRLASLRRLARRYGISGTIGSADTIELLAAHQGHEAIASPRKMSSSPEPPENGTPNRGSPASGGMAWLAGRPQLTRLNRGHCS